MTDELKRDENIDADIIVIGGGAAGLMAAGRAAQLGANVLLLEKTESLGKKILVSGKTRCNLTNSADLKDFIVMYGIKRPFFAWCFSSFLPPGTASLSGTIRTCHQAGTGRQNLPCIG